MHFLIEKYCIDSLAKETKMIRLWLVVVLNIAAHAARQDLDDHWSKYKENHNKNYDSFEEEQRRRQNFEEHHQNVMEHNAKYDMGLVSYQKSVDHQHADMSYEELKKTILGIVPPSFTDGATQVDYSKVPSTRASSIDWRTSGRVTAVKDQGKCGSCWAFATVGALEGQFAACKNNTAQQLSEQYLMDCAKVLYKSKGCGGGWPSSAYEFIRNNGGLPLQSDYPYLAKDGNCPLSIPFFAPKYKMHVPLWGKAEVIPKFNEDAVAFALEKQGPLAAAIHASKDFIHYKDGVFDQPGCDKQANHGVTIVGSGTDEKTGLDFWIIKNSWGEKWGDKGYIRVRRNSDNLCGVASNVVYPIAFCSFL